LKHLSSPRSHTHRFEIHRERGRDKERKEEIRNSITTFTPPSAAHFFPIPEDIKLKFFLPLIFQSGIPSNQSELVSIEECPLDLS
jgi:hypothetical protein